MSEQLTLEKWEELKALYGKNAYLMVQGGVTTYNSYGDIEFSGCVDMPENVSFDDFVNGMDDIWIKDSASLSFDLERAKSGDAIQINHCSEKYDVVRFNGVTEEGIYEQFSVSFYYKGELITEFFPHWQLTIKYPPKVKK